MTLAMTLEEIRRKIDEIDFELFKLMEERMEWALRTRRLKPASADPRREAMVLEKAAGAGRPLLRPEFNREIIERVVSESRALQEKGLSLIGFQGEHGAFSEEAVRFRFPGQVALPHPEFEDVFKGVEDGSLDYGVVPVENTLGGTVTRINELLLQTPLHVVGEIRVRISHCLLALPGTDPKEIKAVYSHPRALAQCQGFLRRNRLEARPFYDTAGAARMLFEERPPAAAAVAGEMCARLYRLEVIKSGLEDRDTNETRFFVLSREPRTREGNKCSLAFDFETADKAGSLFSVLRVFAEAGLNLTRIESFPRPADPSGCAFFLDFHGTLGDPAVAGALDRLKTVARFVKIFGCYDEARR